MNRRNFLEKTSTAGLLTLITPTGLVQALRRPAVAGLVQSFQSPPATARPEVMWFWMNGNVTRQGITLDLEAMQRVGIGGVLNFDAGVLIPKGSVEYLSPEWLALKQHAFAEAQRLGLEYTMHNCPGWTASGGPWITPERAMQELTWSESHLTGGRKTPLALPQPMTRLGHYRDVAVLAFPSLPGEAALTELLAGATSSRGAVALAQLESQPPTELLVPATASQPGWLQLEFKQPYEATGLVFITSVPADDQVNPLVALVNNTHPAFVLEASDDGVQYRPVTDIATTGAPERERVVLRFPAVQARYFRLRSAQSRNYAQLRFSGATALAGWLPKANFEFGRWDVEGDAAAPVVPAGSVLDLAAVVDVTSFLDANGTLRWLAPAGRWTILRLGYTAQGHTNNAAPDTGVGLECDKFSKEAITFHFNKMMENLLPALGGLAAEGRFGLEIDSYEVGMQNWTANFPQEFRQRRGYDLLPHLPAMTGRVVGSPEASNRFLWDVRRAQADLMADNYYGQFATLCRQHRITSYVEPYDQGPMEEMQIGARADVDLGEFWSGLSTMFQNNRTMRRSVKLAASISHVNGRQLVGAEAYTGEPDSARWQEYPFALKALGDRFFTLGTNRLVFHRFAHQPHPTAVPGMAMGPFGIQFDRTNTWWEQSRAWLQYLARCQSLLQQGLFVADLAYFTGEQPNQYTAVNRADLTPPPPPGYDYDLLNAEVLLGRARVAQGRLTLPDGLNYRALVLQQFPGLSLGLLRKLRELVNQGLTVVGARPQHSLGLADQAHETEFQQLVAELWGPAGAGAVDRPVGQGRVCWGQPLPALLASWQLAPDFEWSARSGEAALAYVHRRIDGAEVYFISNQRRTAEELVGTFRVAGQQPELWDPATGLFAPLGVYEAAAGGRTRVALQLDPVGSAFVVFRQAAPAKRWQAVLRGGAPVLAATPFPALARPSLANVVNDFTVSLWAKPEIGAMLSATGNFMGPLTDAWTDYYAIYPPAGQVLYGARQASAGLAIGRNGVAVWENAAKPVLVLAAPVPLAGWSHVALVYRQGVPTVYANGQLVATGQKSAYTVHPALGDAPLPEGSSYYAGDLTTPQLRPEALAADGIRQLAAQARPPLPPAPAVTLAGNGATQLLFWQNGPYQLRDGAGRTTPLAVAGIAPPEELRGPWPVSFPPRLGAPARIVLPHLQSLHTHAQPGVKYFSGTATYAKTVDIAASRLARGQQLFLDLGRVEVIAEVVLNGQNLGILWQRPYRVDITRAAKVGTNQLEIRVTNQWPNRLIGDEQLPDPDTFSPGGGGGGLSSLINGAIQKLPDWYQQGRPKPDDGRVTFTPWKHFTKDAPLLEAGLIGPVQLLSAAQVAI
ncbi:MAG: glycosyl hydrolase [Janthinobacterium lividum]